MLLRARAGGGEAPVFNTCLACCPNGAWANANESTSSAEN